MDLRVKLALLVLAAFSITESKPLMCPKPDGRFPNPKDCSSFLQCSGGVAAVVDCPVDLHFNRMTLVCDRKENVVCRLGEVHDLRPKLYHVPYPWWECTCDCCVDPDPADCQAFFRCEGGKAYRHRCADGLLFNHETYNCDYAHNVECGKTTEGEPEVTTPEEVVVVTTVADESAEADTTPPPTPTVDDGDTSESSGDGSSSSSESSGDGSSESSGDGSSESSTDSSSGGSDESNETNEPETPKPPTVEPETPKPTNPCKEEGDLLPNPDDCGSFFHCSHGVAHLKDCPSILHFNPVLKVCDWPEKAGCEPFTPEPDTPKPPPETPEPPVVEPETPKPTNPCKEEGDLLPNPDDCGSFFHCSHGVAYLKDCPSILHFNPVLKVCDWPEKAGCEHFTPEPDTPKPPPETPEPPVVEPETPKPTNPCKEEGDLLPNPDDCGSFFHCSHGVAYLKDCPSILHFNPVLKVCDWPEKAGCEPFTPEPDTPKPPPETPEPPVVEPETPKPTNPCKEEGDLLPNPDDCGSFFHCSHGVAYLKDCPSILHFNPVLKVCDWPEKAGCEPFTPEPDTPKPPPETPEPPVVEPETPKPTNPCKEEGDLLPNPDDCGSFFHCSHGVAYLKDCPSILHFNPVLKVCDWPEKAGCEPFTPEPDTPKPPPETPEPPVVEPETPKPTTPCKEEGDLLPNPDDCGSFFHCSHGVAYLKDCPSILHFNPVLKVCDWPEKAGCEPFTPEPDTPKPPPETPEPPVVEPETPKPTTPCKEEGDLLPNPDDCGSFFHCSHGVAYLKDCPSILHFNPVLKVCDWPEKAGCEPFTPEPDTPKPPPETPEPPVVEPETPKPTTPCKEEGDLLPNPDDCGSFFHCSHGVAYLKDCPSILHFNPVLKVCDWPEKAGCEPFTPEPDTPKPPPETPEPPVVEPETPKPTNPCKEEGDLLPNPDDCGSFFHCSHGVAYLKDCPSILHFNPVLKVCDWPEKAGCEPFTPEPDTPKPPPETPEPPVVEPETPKPTNPCKEEGDLLPNPDDCGSFFHCSHGVAYLKDCPSILHFNPVLKVCDWPEKAGCEPFTPEPDTPKPPPETPEPPVVEPETPKPTNPCKEEGDLLPNPDDCGSFFHCSHGVAYLKDCPSILHFNPVLKVCDWPEKAGCEPFTPEPDTPKPPPETPEPPVVEPETPKPTNPCKEEGDLLPNPDDCGSFFHCSHGVAYLKDCPSILHFNPVLKVCDWPEKAGCEPFTPEPDTPKPPPETPEPPVVEPETPKPTTPCKEEGDLLPNPDDCGSFFHCSHGVAYLKDCPSILHFNPVLKVCDWPEKAGCEPFTPEPDTPKPPPETPEPPVVEPETPKPTNPCKEEGDLLPNPDDCGSFFHCSHGVAYLKDCPSILHFNPVLKVCDWPEKAGCEPFTPEPDTPKPPPETPEPPVVEPETPKPTTPCKEEGDLLPNPDDCGSFFHCSHGVAYLKDCPSILHFNPVLKVCDWPEKAGCEPFTPEPDTPKPPPETPEPPVVEPETPKPINPCKEEGDLLPNPDDCGSFFHCSHGVPYLKDCPSILHFNPVLKVCDWPEKAGCQPSTPEPDTPKPPTDKPITIPTTTIAEPKPPHNCTCEPVPEPPKKNCTVVPGDICKTSSGLFPNPNDCTTFYHCSHGVAYLKQCPANLHFNPTKLVCDWPAQAGCSKPEIILPTPCKTPSGLFPHPTECTQFYHCSHGFAYLKTCPGDLHFNPHLLVCDWPKDAGCVIEEVTPPPVEDDFTGPPEVCTTPSGLFPHPTDCHKFYHCSHNVAYEKDCPGDLHFNPDLLVCDWPEEAGCKNGDNDHDTCTKSPDDKTTKKPKPTRPTKPKPTRPTKPKPTRPTKPKPTRPTKPKPTGPTKPKPTRPTKPKPTRPTKPKPTKPTKPTKPNPSTHCRKEGDLLPDPRDCGRFFHCSHGVAYSKKCPSILHFNPALKVCDWPEKAGCTGPQAAAIR